MTSFTKAALVHDLFDFPAAFEPARAVAHR